MRGAILLVVALALPAAADDNPEIMGRPLGQWINRLSDPDRKERMDAASAIALLGPKAERAAGPLDKALREAFGDKSDDQINLLLRALGSIGPRAALAVPTICDALRLPYPGPQAEALRALGRIGDTTRGLKAIVAAAKSPIDSTRIEVMFALGQYSPAPKEAFPVLREGLRDRSAEVRAAATRALGLLSRRSEDALAALSKAMNDLGAEAREMCIRELVSLGPFGAPALVAALKSPKAELKRSCAEALEKLGVAAAAFEAQLEEAAAAKDQTVAGPAGRALEKIREPAEGVARAASDLGASDAFEREKAVVILESLALRAGEAAPSLVASLLDPDPRVAAAVARALPALGRPAVDALAASLGGPNAEFRALCARVLGDFGEIGQAGIPALESALKDADPRVQAAARESLEKLRK